MRKLMIRLNPDDFAVAQITQQIKKNGGYCPCSIKKSEDTYCMCKAFRERKEPGYCHCGLYYKEYQEIQGE